LRWATQQLGLLDQLGIPYTVLDPAACMAIEPALEHMQAPLRGALYLPMDETGDCALFTRKLEALATERGVVFRYNTRVDDIEIVGDQVKAVRTVHDRYEADRYVISLGAGSIHRLRALGLNVPLQPVKTYNLIFPLRENALAPRMGLIDEKHRIAVTRVGDRLCVGGKAELGSWSAAPRPQRGAALAALAREIYPDCADYEQPDLRAGLQATTPDGPPLLGATQWNNLLLNIGHGAHGWTMACGSAKIIADLVAQRKPEISLSGLEIARYEKG